MVEKTVTVRHRAGIHARPAALIVKTANQFSSDFFIEKDTMKINGKSIMGIITLGASYKTQLKIILDGDDEQEAAKAIEALFENRFEEPEVNQP
ncbi:MAG: HPr family phosphocarrier protein [Spirochaetota bacterium]